MSRKRRRCAEMEEAELTSLRLVLPVVPLASDFCFFLWGGRLN